MTLTSMTTFNRLKDPEAREERQAYLETLAEKRGELVRKGLLGQITPEEEAEEKRINAEMDELEAIDEPYAGEQLRKLDELIAEIKAELRKQGA